MKQVHVYLPRPVCPDHNVEMKVLYTFGEHRWWACPFREVEEIACACRAVRSKDEIIPIQVAAQNLRNLSSVR